MSDLICPVCRKEHSPFCCAWCGEEPCSHKHFKYSEDVYFYCGSTPECLNCKFAQNPFNPDSYSLVLEDWNSQQTGIIAKLRKAFEAGYDAVMNDCYPPSPVDIYWQDYQEREARK